MASPKINISGVSKLADLPLTTEEEKLYENHLGAILDYVKLIESADTKSTDPTFNISKDTNITRKDIVSKSITQDDAVLGARVKKNGFIVSKGVFENE